MEDRIYSFLGGIDEDEEENSGNSNDNLEKVNHMSTGLYFDINGKNKNVSNNLFINI